jgi:DNA polymerase-1
LTKLPGKEPETAAAAPSTPVEIKKAETRYQTVHTEEALKELAERLTAAETLALSTEGSSLSPMSAQIVGIALSPSEGEAYYIPVAGLTAFLTANFHSRQSLKY